MEFEGVARSRGEVREQCDRFERCFPTSAGAAGPLPSFSRRFGAPPCRAVLSSLSSAKQGNWSLPRILRSAAAVSANERSPFCLASAVWKATAIRSGVEPWTLESRSVAFLVASCFLPSTSSCAVRGAVRGRLRSARLRSATLRTGTAVCGRGVCGRGIGGLPVWRRRIQTRTLFCCAQISAITRDKPSQAQSIETYPFQSQLAKCLQARVVSELSSSSFAKSVPTACDIALVFRSVPARVDRQPSERCNDGFLEALNALVQGAREDLGLLLAGGCDGGNEFRVLAHRGGLQLLLSFTLLKDESCETIILAFNLFSRAARSSACEVTNAHAFIIAS